MTIRDYLTQKFQTFGIQLSDADILSICIPYGLIEEEDVTSDNFASIEIAIVSFIPTLLLRATSIGENGFSMHWDIEGIKAYYAKMCRTYGLDDELNDKPKISFR